MPENELWKLNITAKSEITVPADVEKLLLDWHEGKRGNRAATKDLKKSAFVFVAWSVFKLRLERDIMARNDVSDAEEADREALRTLATQRDWARQQHPEENVPTVLAHLRNESVLDVEKQLERLDEEDAAGAAE